jgi:hypothetical protein
MIASLSVERKIQNVIDLRETSADFISSLATLHSISGASTSRLYQAMRDSTRNLPAETAIPLGKLVDDLEDYCRSVHPVPVALRNAVLIKELLDNFRESRKEQINLRPTPFSIVLIGGKPFKRISSGQVETVAIDDLQSCAAFEDSAVAYAAAQILSGHMGQIGVRFTNISNERRAPETFVSKLADVGFTQ